MADKKFASISPHEFSGFNRVLEEHQVNTICNSGICPNRPECFRRNHVAFLILGDTCTRNCLYCNVRYGQPKSIDSEEPERIALAVKKLGIGCAVVTSVTRDDLGDGGASQFAATLKQIKKQKKNAKIEFLIPDFQFNLKAADMIIESGPDIINHNIETVKKLFSQLRPQGNYEKSLKLLKYIKDNNSAKAKTSRIITSILTKSGFMIGLGETIADIKETLQDLKKSQVDVVTIGQYLSPDKEHYPVKKMYSEEEFKKIKAFAEELGFKAVAVGRNIRSSYNSESQII